MGYRRQVAPVAKLNYWHEEMCFRGSLRASFSALKEQLLEEQFDPLGQYGVLVAGGTELMPSRAMLDHQRGFMFCNKMYSVLWPLKYGGY